MNIIYENDKYIQYMYDTYLEYIDHFKQNRSYFLHSFIDEDGHIIANYNPQIKLAHSKVKKKTDLRTPLDSFLLVLSYIDCDDQIKKEKDVGLKGLEDTEENLMERIELSLDINDKVWFMELSERLNILRNKKNKKRK